MPKESSSKRCGLTGKPGLGKCDMGLHRYPLRCLKTVSRASTLPKPKCTLNLSTTSAISIQSISPKYGLLSKPNASLAVSFHFGTIFLRVAGWPYTLSPKFETALCTLIEQPLHQISFPVALCICPIRLFLTGDPSSLCLLDALPHLSN